MSRRETETLRILSGISTIHEANMKHPHSEHWTAHCKIYRWKPVSKSWMLPNSLALKAKIPFDWKYYYVNTCGTEQETCSSSREICNSTPRRADIYSTKHVYTTQDSAIILPLTLKRRSSICMLSSSFVHSYSEIFKLWREHATRQKKKTNKQTNKRGGQIPRQIATNAGPI